MANQTITAGQVRNHDSAEVLGLLDGEAYTINGGSLTANADSRWGQNAAVFGSVTLSATLGGTFIVDGRDIWEIPFSASTGNVPTLNALGSNGVTGGTSGATGELFRVWATGSFTPSAAGGAMPATGFIKLRSKSGTFQSGETITLPGGATITASSAGKRSWINHVALAAASSALLTITNFSTVEILGDWYELGTTNGADDQTFQFPVDDYCPAIQIETAVGSGEYEWWLNAGDRWGANASQNPGSGQPYVPTDIRGKFFGQNNTTRVITIAQRASNPCGYKPVSGLKVRMPNIVLSGALSTNYAANVLPTTITQRPRFTSSGILKVYKAICNWYMSVSRAAAVDLQDTAITTQFVFTELNSGPVDIKRCAVSFAGGYDTTETQRTTALVSCIGGGTMEDCVIAGFSSGQATPGSTTTISTTLMRVDGVNDYTWKRCKFIFFGGMINTVATFHTRGSASSYPFSISLGKNLTVEDCAVIGGTCAIRNVTGCTVKNLKYADLLGWTTDTVQPVSGVTLIGSCIDTTIDGFSNFENLSNVHPYNGLVVIGTLASSGNDEITVQNIGSPSSPYNCGTANEAGYLIRIGANASNLTFRRIYGINTRNTTSPVITNEASALSTDMLIENVWGDEADSQYTSGVDGTIRGCRWSPAYTSTSPSAGIHFEDSFGSTTDGRVVIWGASPTTASAGQVAFSSGLKFSGTGFISMPSVDDNITFTMPYFALGHTSLGIPSSPTVAVGARSFGAASSPIQNFKYEYKVDTGSGFSSTWKEAFGCRARSSGGTSGTNTVVFTAVTASRAPAIGDYIQVATFSTPITNYLPIGTKITNVSGTTITTDNNFTVSAATGSYIFYWSEIQSETVSPTNGFRLQVRVTTMVANSANTIQAIVIPTATNSTDQQLQYPLPGSILTVTNLVAQSRVKVTRADTGAFLGQKSSGAGTQVVFDLNYTGTVVVEVRNASSTPSYKPWVSQVAISPSVSTSLVALQEVD